MRSTPWTCGIPSVARYELRDEENQILGTTESHAEGTRMLQAFVLTSPGREHDIALVAVAANGAEVIREDIFDIEVASIET